MGGVEVGIQKYLHESVVRSNPFLWRQMPVGGFQIFFKMGDHGRRVAFSGNNKNFHAPEALSNGGHAEKRRDGDGSHQAEGYRAQPPEKSGIDSQCDHGPDHANGGLHGMGPYHATPVDIASGIPRLGIPGDVAPQHDFRDKA